METLSIAAIKAQLARTPDAEVPSLIAQYAGDSRAGVQAALRAASRALERQRVEFERLSALAARERHLLDSGCVLVAGVDEVGRGALAGPVTAGACIMPRDAMLTGLNDSKRLTPSARERLATEIAASAVAVAVGHAEPAEIDAHGIAAATVLAMRRALAALGMPIDHVLVDGNAVDLGMRSTAIVGGDASVRAIAAAAVYAKVTRDSLMLELDALYPGYGLAGNKGYGSAGHLDALLQLGPSPIHRRSFSPCSQTALF